MGINGRKYNNTHSIKDDKSCLEKIKETSVEALFFFLPPPIPLIQLKLFALSKITWKRGFEIYNKK